MAITDARKRHKLMERAIRSLMGVNLPPRFKFKDTYASIEVPAEYTQHLPTQQEIETKFEELEVQEEAVEAVATEATVISKFNSVITSNLEVGTSNLFVDTETGRVGIGLTNPQVELDVLGEMKVSANVEVGTANLFVDTVSGNVGIGVTNPTAKLHVNGGITKTQYNPGEIIETLQGRANGRSIQVLSGTYTLTNVTGAQDATTSFVVINGSSISYKPPPGTTRVIYEFWCFMRQTDVDPILHFAGRVAGTQVTDSRHTWRQSTLNNDYQTWIYNNMTLTIGEVASDNLANGQLASWTANKTLDFTFREYSASYEGRLHLTNHWDGAGTDIVVKPVIKITAIA
jgi:hypothetical protein